MLKLLILLCLPLVGVSSGAIFLAIISGGGLQSKIVSAEIRDQNRLFTSFVLIDLDRELNVEFMPPVKDIREVVISPYTGRDALLFTQYYEDGVNQRILYHYTLDTRQLHTLNNWLENDVPGSAVRISGIQNYVFGWSPDGQSLIFIEPINFAVDIINLETFSWNRLPNILDNSISFSTWSPDSQQIALMGDDQLTVINVDGSNIRHIALPLIGMTYQPFWSQDSQYILINHLMDESDDSRSLIVIDTRTATILPATTALNGSHASWNHWCDQERLQYFKNGEAHQFNLQTGEDVNLNETLHMSNSLILNLYWPPGNCEWLVIIGSTNSKLPVYSLYYYDVGLKVKRLLENGFTTIIQLAPEGFLYESVTPQFQIALSHAYIEETIQTEQIGLFTDRPLWHQWSDDFSSAIGALYGGDWELFKFNRDTGMIRYLTLSNRIVNQYILWR